MILMAALSSLLWPGLEITVLPFRNNAAAHARCIELLEAGAWMLPFNLELLMVTSILFLDLNPDPYRE